MGQFQVINDHSMHTRFLGPDSLVMDLGANAGHFAHAMVERFGCSCVAVEPSPEMFARIVPHPRIRAVQAAVTPADGPVRFHVSSGPLNSSLAQVPEDYVNTIAVEGKRLDTLAREAGWDHIDLLKMDIEGIEIQVLRSCSPEFLQSIGQMAIEFHDFNGMLTKEEVAETLAYLETLGFAWVTRYRGCFYDTWLVNLKRCPVSAGELLWIRHGVRNAMAIRRRLGRMTSKSAS